MKKGLFHITFSFLLLSVSFGACVKTTDTYAFKDIRVSKDVTTDLADNVDNIREIIGIDVHSDGNTEDGGLLTLPVEPLPPTKEQVISDRKYSQEFNHTWNEQEYRDPLVALVMPPAGYGDMKDPWMVTQSGVVIRNQAGHLEEMKISGEDQLIDAETAMGSVFLASPTQIYAVDRNGTASVVAASPQDATILRLKGSAQGLYILTSVGPGFLGLNKTPVWSRMTPVPTAVNKTKNDLLLAWKGHLADWRSVTGLPSGKPAWKVDMEVVDPVAILRNRTLPQPLDIVVVGQNVINGFNLTEKGAKLVDVGLFHKDRMPLIGIASAGETSDGGIIAGADSGAWRLKKSGIGLEYRVYTADRWMPGSNVRDVLETGNGIWFATDRGPGKVTTKSWSLQDKMDAMVKRIVARHDRDGAVSDSHLTKPGDLSTNIPWDSDNDGGWTCYWVMAECLRYKVTGDPKAKAHFDESLARMLSLRTLTNTDYFVARSVIRINGCKLDDCDNPDDGAWFKSPDGKWWVKGDTSNDEVDSHMFMMGLAYDYCADDTQKKAIAAHVDGIVGGIIDHNYRLIDPQTGKCTTYGQFGPAYVNDWVEGKVGDGGVRSAEMLGALNLAWHVTGKQKYLDIKNDLITNYHYGQNVANMGNIKVYPFCAGSGDCDELGMQALFTLIRYESDPKLRALWLQGWNSMYDHLKLQEDAFWDTINAVLGGKNVDISKAIRWFKGYPVDLIRWKIHNERRQDVIPAPAYYYTVKKDPNLGMRSDGHIFPEDERPNDRHNTLRFKLSGGLGPSIEMDSADVLFTWWLGRYYGFIKAKNSP